MKTLYLIRHAKSSWKDLTLDDFDRPLNKRGTHDSKLMGELLKNKPVQPDLILSSPAKRAKITATTFASALGYEEKSILFQEEIYEASTQDLLLLLRSTENHYKTLFLIGHNPSLNMLLDYLVKNHDIENIVTTGIVTISLTMDNWHDITQNSGELLSFEFPKKYYT